MSLIQLFFRQSVTIRPFIRIASGEPIYGEPETRRCRLERGKTLQKSFSPDGVVNQAPSGARLYCTGSAIPLGSIVETPERDYIVTQCQVLNGFADDHLEVTLQ